METEGDFWLKILQIIIIPIVVATLALFWNSIQNWYKRHIFQKFIFREFEEISPNDRLGEGMKWYEYLQKEFVHQKIFENIKDNRDFILSLDPDLIYHLTQLWYTYKRDKDYQESSGSEWLYHLEKILEYAKIHNLDKNKEIEKAYTEWIKKINPYENL